MTQNSGGTPQRMADRATQNNVMFDEVQRGQQHAQKRVYYFWDLPMVHCFHSWIQWGMVLITMAMITVLPSSSLKLSVVHTGYPYWVVMYYSCLMPMVLVNPYRTKVLAMDNWKFGQVLMVSIFVVIFLKLILKVLECTTFVGMYIFSPDF